MPKNKLAGKGKGPNHKGTGRDYSKEKKYQSSEERKDYRVELNRENRKKGTYGKLTKMGKDRSHTKDGKLVLESRKRNRSRNGKNGRSTKK
jgi:hypothetical protein